ncbi:hypothetical protein [Amycolatopsis pigmentata]|uniref:Uncharacterized protein n=1 Tax=Amycolatopsis pigmentata TaxID=450801 RepID=A0ABW5FJL8_9PSEU
MKYASSSWEKWSRRPHRQQRQHRADARAFHSERAGPPRDFDRVGQPVDPVVDDDGVGRTPRAFAAVSALPLTVRRRAPLPVALVCGVGSIGLMVAHGNVAPCQISPL